MITSIEGNRDKKDIRNFVDNYLLARYSQTIAGIAMGRMNLLEKLS
jgi:hypothetical protein